MDARGDVLEPLVADEVAAATRKLVAEGVEAIAVCFLFAYANPFHEKAAAAIIHGIAPDLYISLSHEVNPEWREYERTASTVANAYIGPPVSRYLHDLEQLSVERFPRARALMMKSDGGAGSAAMLASTPIRTVMSGPVAGVIGSRYLGDVKGIDKLISFDVGGTSSDMAVIPGLPLFKSEFTVARHPMRSHTVDIETIGAGGGSIARWLRDRVSPGGRVVALDLDIRFIEDEPGIEARQGNLLEAELERDAYDLVHCRALLHHLRGAEVAALRRMAAALRPGGVLVAEEPYLGAMLASRTPAYVAAFEALHHAMPNADYAWAVALPAALHAAGLSEIEACATADVVQGATPQAELLRLTIEAIRDRIPPDTDIDAGIELLRDPEAFEPGVVWYTAWGRVDRSS
jgi:SAM-dependent methyltransferase